MSAGRITHRYFCVVVPLGFRWSRQSRWSNFCSAIHFNVYQTETRGNFFLHLKIAILKKGPFFFEGFLFFNRFPIEKQYDSGNFEVQKKNCCRTPLSCHTNHTFKQDKTGGSVPWGILQRTSASESRPISSFTIASCWPHHHYASFEQKRNESASTHTYVLARLPFAAKLHHF